MFLEVCVCIIVAVAHVVCFDSFLLVFARNVGVLLFLYFLLSCRIQQSTTHGQLSPANDDSRLLQDRL